MLDRKSPPIIQDALQLSYILPEVAKQTFKNDIDVYALNAGSQDVLQIEWVFEAGIWNEPATGVAQAMGALLKSGTDQQNALAINEAIEYYGASLSVGVSNDYTTISLHTLTRHLAKVLPLVHEVITSANYPEDELQLYVQSNIQRLAVKLLQCDFVANRHIEALVFGKAHPYGRYSERADLEALRRDEILKYHQDYIDASRCTIFVAGRYQEGDLRLLEQYFGHEGFNNKHLGEEHVSAILASSVRKFDIINDEKGVQAAIRIANNFVERTHPDYVPMGILNTVFGGYFGSRLMSNIREEKGFTYGIYSYQVAYKHGSMLMITSEVGRDVHEKALTEIYREMETLQQELISDEELRLVKNYVLGSLLGDLDGPFEIIKLWKNLILKGFKKEQFAADIETYKTVSSATLQRLAQEYFKPLDFYQVAVV